MIRFAKDEDYPQLKALWNQVFSDSEAEIDFYFSNRHQNQNMLVYELEEVIAGMLTMLPVQLSFGPEMHSGRYIYAAATAPAYRRQGISSRLLLHCHNWMEENGETASILVPASDSLFAFYGQRGYETVFYVETTTLRPSDLLPYTCESICEPCLVQDFFRLRDAAFSDCSLFVRWGEDALEYIIRNAQVFGDGVYYFRTESGEGYAVCGWSGRNVFIREIAFVQMELSTAVSILHHTLGADNYILRLPEGSMKGVVPRPFGMIHYPGAIPALTGKPPYLSLVLD